MTKGAPDGTKVSIIRNGDLTGDMFGVQNSIDLAEHSSRQGGAMWYDRRGQHAWSENFDALTVLSQHWGVWNNVAGDTAVLVNTYGHRGAKCCKMTLAADLGGSIAIDRNEAGMLTDRMGLQCSFAGENSSFEYAYFHMRMSIIKDGYLHTVEVRLNVNTGALEYYNSSAGWTQFAVRPGNRIVTDPYAWYTAKIVADFDTNKYVRFMFSGTEYDLSAAELYVEANSSPEAASITLEMNPRTADGAICYVDDIVLTNNEP